MDTLPEISTSLFFTAFYLMAMLVIPQISYAQMTSTRFEPFKVELHEQFSPADEKLLKDEISEIITIQEETDPWLIRYWNGSYPSYRWHELLMKVSRNHKGHKNGGRVAIMHLSIYDAIVEVHKTAPSRKAAYLYDPRIKKLGKETDIVICEWSAAAGA
jgi:hypothetical protein